MKKHNHQTRVLGVALLGLVTGCTGTGSDFRSVFSMTGASDRAMVEPYASGKEHLNAGRLGNAVAEFRMALAQNPADVESLNGLAAAYDRLGRHDLAEKLYRRALDLNPSNLQTLNNFGYSNLLQGRLDVATALLADAHDTDPVDPIISTNLEIVQSIRAAQQAEVRQPDVVESWRTAAAQDTGSRVERTTAVVQSLVLQQGIESTSPASAETAPQESVPPTGLSGSNEMPENPQTPTEESQPVVHIASSEQKRPADEDRRPQPTEITVVPLPDQITPITIAQRWTDIRQEKRSIVKEGLFTKPIEVAVAPAQDPIAPATNTLQQEDRQVDAMLTTLSAGPAASVNTKHDVVPSLAPVLLVSNGTGREYMARRVGGYLGENDVAVVGYNNADSYSYPNSTIFYKQGWEFYADYLSNLLPGRLDVVIDNGLVADIDIRLGADLLDFDKALYYADIWYAPGVATYPNIVVSNGTDRLNMDARIQSFLKKRDVEVTLVAKVELSADVRTTVYYSEDWSIHALRLARLLPVDVALQATDDPSVEVRIELGDDLLAFDQTLINVSEIDTYAWSI